MPRAQGPALVHRSPSEDPLTTAIQPPPNESPEERQERLKNEAAAKLWSDTIDEYLKSSAKKAKATTKLLLLGQSESGKSTTLKVMKMLYAKDDFAQERLSWKAIIQLNLIRHVLTILKILEEEAAGSSPSSAPSPVSSDTDLEPPRPPSSHNSSTQPAHRLSNLSLRVNPPPKPLSTQTAFHHTLRLRLAPLAEIESNLSKQLTQSALSSEASKEPMVHSYMAWMKHFGYKASSPGASSSQAASPASTVGWHFEDEAARVINLCKDDIAALWGDKIVRGLLRERKVRLELEGGFFLDDLDRVCALNYEPTDLDVCKARLKTMGVTETNFRVKQGVSGTGDWKVYDVGGSRTLRSAWVPFFDDVNAILFLAPISAFDQLLEEDSRIYRIEDSMLLWREICRNKLLARVDLILFLNKVDLLQKKLVSGIPLKKYLPQYAGPNTVAEVCKYFEKQFMAIHREGLKHLNAELQDPAKSGGKANSKERALNVHCTSVIDTDATKDIIHEVQNFIFTGNMRSAHIL